MPFLLLVATVVAVPLLILDEQGLPRYRALNSEVGDVRERNDELRRQIEQLQTEVIALKTDPNVIERIARDEMSMVCPGEIVFQFAD